MRKYKYIALLALIGCAVYLTGCELIPKMADPLLSDAEQVEPMEMPVGFADVLIYTGASWWITAEDAAIEAEITQNLAQAAGIEVAITENEHNVREWMLQTTADGAVNVLVVYGVLPDSVYPAGNSQPDGSILEN